MAQNVNDGDIFDPRNFGDFLRYKRAQIEDIARRAGYLLVAWHDGCVYSALDGVRVFSPANHSNNAEFTGWRNEFHYLGLNEWLRGDQRRGFVPIPLSR